MPDGKTGSDTQMALQPGDKFGPYLLIAPIGKGGMGEVYRARDIKLKRDVALKVLPEAFASMPYGSGCPWCLTYCVRDSNFARLSKLWARYAAFLEDADRFEQELRRFLGLVVTARQPR